MPNRAPRPCTTPACPYDQPCPVHRYDPEHSRRAHQRYGGAEYQRNRGKVLKQARYACELCGAPTRQVHHRVAIKNGGTHKMYNLIAVCRYHHEQMEKAEERRAAACR